ncbi:MAG: 30S ribosomal protein S25e [Sulfolobaceae archaeon]
MGGATKKPISTMEKRQKRMAEEQQKKTAKRQVSKTGKEVISNVVYVDKETIKKVEEELKKEKIVTPYTLSTKLGVTISVSKKILEELERQGNIKLVSKNRRVALYVASS